MSIFMCVNDVHNLPVIYGYRRKSSLKIWRYVDLAKFVHMLATGALYFPCATTELKDPYEGWLPRSHIKALEQINRGILDQMKTTHDAFLAQHPACDRAPFDGLLEEAETKRKPPAEAVWH